MAPLPSAAKQQGPTPLRAVEADRHSARAVLRAVEADRHSARAVS
jgi:hypothetical protein